MAGDAVDQRVLDRAAALRNRHRASPPTAAQAAAIIDEVLDAAGGGDVYGYLLNQAHTVDLRTPRDGALLWSGRHRSGVSNRYVAEAYATDPRARAGTRAPIELTPGARRLHHILEHRRVWQELVTPAEQRVLWDVLSERFAAHARGDVLVFSDRPHSRSVLWRRELPALRRNPDIGTRRIRFAYGPGDDLSAVARRALTDDVRARVQFDDPDRPGYVDLNRLNRFTDIRAAVRYLRGIVGDDTALGPRPPMPAEPRRGAVPAVRAGPAAGGILPLIYLLVLAACCCGGVVLVRQHWPAFVAWVQSGDPDAVLTGHTGDVTSVAYSRDGKTLASGGRDNTARLWNVTDPAHPTPGATLTGHTQDVNSVSFSADGTVLATASEDRTVRLWNVATRRTVRILRHKYGVRSVAYSPDGRILATGGGDHHVILWDPATGRTLATLTGHTGAVNAVSFSGDGRLLASGGDDNTVRLWDVRGRRGLLTIRGHTGRVTAVAVSPDGKTVTSSGADPNARVWDTATGRQVRTLGGSGKYRTDAVAYSPDGRLLATGSQVNSIALYEAPTGEVIAGVGTHSGGITGLAFSPDSRTLASSSGDATIELQRRKVPAP